MYAPGASASWKECRSELKSHLTLIDKYYSGVCTIELYSIMQLNYLQMILFDQVSFLRL